MDKKSFQTILITWFPWIDSRTFLILDSYKVFLQKYNKHTNLTRLDDDQKIYQDYFLASLEPFKNLDFFNEHTNAKLIDIGSGSGIPGVLLKIIFRNLKVTLLDSNKKKADFLKALISHLNLSDCQVVCERAETYSYLHNEEFDFATSRAVSELRKILELSVRFVKRGGYLIEPKGLKGLEELIESKNALIKLNLDLSLNRQTDFYGYKHYLFVFKKINSTDKIYPRMWKQILKEPL